MLSGPASIPEPSSGTTLATYTLAYEVGDSGSVTATTGAASDTATADSDYQRLEGQPVTAPTPTMLTTTFTVTINGDASDEPGETLTVAISGTNVHGSPVVTTINDDADAPPTVTLQDGSGTEGTTGQSNLVLPVQLSAASGYDIALNWTAAATGTATAGDDFATSGTATIPRNTNPGGIPIPLVTDNLGEDNETFTVTLSTSDPNAGMITTPTATATILDDDTPVVIGGVAVAAEGDGSSILSIPFALSNASARTVTVTYKAVDGSAVAFGDYQPTSGTLTFPPGQLKASVPVTIIGDLVPEPDEVVAVVTSDAVNAGAGQPGIGGILNDDKAGSAAGTAGGLPAGTTPNGDRTPPNIKLGKLTLSGSTMKLPLTCPRTETSCKGSLVVYSRANRRAKVRALRKEVKLGSASATVAGGKRKTIAIKLTRRARKLLKTAGHIDAQAFAVIRDAAGNIANADVRATLRRR